MVDGNAGPIARKKAAQARLASTSVVFFALDRQRSLDGMHDASLLHRSCVPRAVTKHSTLQPLFVTVVAVKLYANDVWLPG